MARSIWKFAAGYVTIKVDGLMAERLVNLAVRRGMVLRQMYRQSYTRFSVQVSESELPVFRQLALECGCTLKVLSSRGLRAMARRVWGRQALLWAGLTAALCVAVASTFVLDVSQQGDMQPAVAARLQEAVQDAGLRPFVRKPALHIREIQAYVYREMPELAFVSIRIKGVRATVTAVEKDTPVPIVPREEPCDLRAAKDAVVENVVVMFGRAAVQKGDVVHKGDLLVSGDGSNGRVHAVAQVTGRVHYSATARGPLYQTLESPTCNRAFRQILRVAGGGEYPWRTDVPPDFAEFRVRESRWTMPLLPLEITRQDYEEVLRRREMNDIA